MVGSQQAGVKAGRLDTAAQAAALDQLYEQVGVYSNRFQPVLHLTDKAVIDGKRKRKWDAATSPYQRLLATEGLTAAEPARLAARYEVTNPRPWRRQSNERLGRLWDEPVVPTAWLPASAAD